MRLSCCILQSSPHLSAGQTSRQSMAVLKKNGHYSAILTQGMPFFRLGMRYALSIAKFVHPHSELRSDIPLAAMARCHGDFLLEAVPSNWGLIHRAGTVLNSTHNPHIRPCTPHCTLNKTKSASSSITSHYCLHPFQFTHCPEVNHVVC